jgi:hypothetical protein
MNTAGVCGHIDHTQKILGYIVGLKPAQTMKQDPASKKKIGQA